VLDDRRAGGPASPCGADCDNHEHANSFVADSTEPAWRGFGLSPPCFSEVAYAVALRARPDLRFAVASGGTATLPLVLALLAATPAALWAAASIGSALTGGTVAASI
jgi:hypothetical protein